MTGCIWLPISNSMFLPYKSAARNVKQLGTKQNDMAGIKLFKIFN